MKTAMKTALCKDSSIIIDESWLFINIHYNELWLFFDQPVIGIEPTFSRMDSVVCWKEDSSFQQISQFVSGLEVINDAAGAFS